ncbi:hypothetical protein MCC01989_08320 [Bifidobacteriaceae bacterium MCC01989]|nr:hypothetical protein MCC01989_08320 [Bifidobacteriaceae bacterium MCC01989]
MSSEKPFWAGKTCKELEGLRVKIAWDNGDTLTSTLNLFGNAGQCELSPARHPAATFAPYADIKSIELVDDPEYERIDDIDDVREGDVYVGTDGNRYPVVELAEFADYPLRVKVSSEACLPHRDYFAYALRPKPQLPDHDGLWLDKNGKTWVVSNDGKAAFDPDSLKWWPVGNQEGEKITGTAFGTYSDTAINLAPFRPAEAVEA